MSIVWKELKVNLKSLIQWSACLLLLIILCALVYGYLFEGKDEVNNYVDLLPQVAQSLIGISPLANYSTAQGFFSLIFIYPTYLLVFAAGFLGTRIITREQEDQAYDFLYSLPMHRNRILLLKLLAGVIFLVITNLAVLLPLRYFFTGQGVNGFITTYCLSNLLLQLMTMSIGMVIACFCRYADRSAQYVGLLILVTIVLDKVLTLFTSAGIFWVLTPFRYFPPLSYLYEGRLPGTALALCVLVIVLANLLLLGLHLRKDFRLSH